jgi:hypothetical protein
LIDLQLDKNKQDEKAASITFAHFSMKLTGEDLLELTAARGFKEGNSLAASFDTGGELGDSLLMRSTYIKNSISFTPNNNIGQFTSLYIGSFRSVHTAEQYRPTHQQISYFCYLKSADNNRYPRVTI